MSIKDSLNDIRGLVDELETAVDEYLEKQSE